jgi:myo-inositol 2-dehydrogenase/D-chiro-inositol 1-dehydrogenase
MDRVRIGLIGAGVMGHIHARGISSHVDRATLVAVADLDQGKASGCAEEFGVSGAYGGYREMLADPSIDAVVIYTPGNTHAEIIDAAANAGKHIFCEKPIDWDLAWVDRALARDGRASAYPAPD